MIRFAGRENISALSDHIELSESDHMSNTRASCKTTTTVNLDYERRESGILADEHAGVGCQLAA